MTEEVAEVVEDVSEENAREECIERLIDESEAVLLDLDDTLVYPTNARQRAYNKVLENYGQEITSDEMGRYAHIRADMVFKAFGVKGNENEEAVRDYIKYFTEFIDDVNIYERVIDLIHMLRERGKDIGIVTNDYRDVAIACLEKIAKDYSAKHGKGKKYGYDVLFKSVWTFGDGKEKPDAEPIVESCNRLGRYNVVVIDDHDVGIKSAKAAGKKAIGLETMRGIFEIEPDCYARNIAEIADIISRKKPAKPVDNYFSPHNPQLKMAA